MAITMSEQRIVSSIMRQYGGSFAQALGVAIGRADPDNAQRIKSAFPELWDGYLDYACTISHGEHGARLETTSAAISA